MRDNMSQRGIYLPLIASIWMALMSFAVAASAATLTSLAEVLYRVLVAVAFMALSAFAYWTASEWKDAADEALKMTPAPVPVQVRRRIRMRH